MKRLAITAAALLAVLWAVDGQANTNDGGKLISNSGDHTICLVNGADTTCITLKGDPTTGGVYAIDPDRDRDKVTLWEDIFGPGTNLAVGAADSTAQPIDVHAYRYLKLLLKLTPVTGANTAGRIAIQFRECMSAIDDSMHTYADYPYLQTNQGVAISAFDSTVTGHIETGSLTTSWSGETIVAVNGNRSASPTASNTDFHWPNGISFVIRDATGNPARFNRLSVRIRNISGSSPTIAYKVSLLGFAQ